MSIFRTGMAFTIIMSAVTFILFGMDKMRAKQKRWRIPEAVLLFFCLMMGGIGGLAGMFFFHHKTRHPSFYIVQLIGSVLWGGVLVFVYICV